MTQLSEYTAGGVSFESPFQAPAFIRGADNRPPRSMSHDLAQLRKTQISYGRYAVEEL